MVEIENGAHLQQLQTGHKQVAALVEADWSVPCRLFKPQVIQAESASSGALFARLDAERLPELADKLGVRSLPTVVLLRGGGIRRAVGVRSAASLLELLK